MSPSDATRPRVVTAFAATLGSLALALWCIVASGGGGGMWLLGGVAVLTMVSGLVLPSALGVGGGLLLLGVQWIGLLYYTGSSGILASGVFGAILLLVAEFAFWSLERPLPGHDQATVAWRRLARIGALAIGAGLVNVVLGLIAGAPLAGNVLLLVVGAGAVALALALIAVVLLAPGANRASRGHPGDEA